MESPVMTSASSHRLRSAVSACAQPSHSCLSSSHLSASVQVESQNSGGCFKKFSNSRKNGDTSPLNVTRKSHSSKRHKSNDKQGSNHRRGKKNGKEVENATNGILNLIPKQLLLENDFLSKLKFSGKLIESKRLTEYLDASPRNESVVTNCEKVTNRKSNHRNIKKNGSIYKFNGSALTQRCSHCSRGKNRGSRRSPGAKNSINEESESCDECPKCGVAHLDDGIRNERQEISQWQPKHAMTRRAAQIVRVTVDMTAVAEKKIVGLDHWRKPSWCQWWEPPEREIKNARHSRVGSSKSVPADFVGNLKDLQLPSASREMLECAKECPGKSLVIYGEFRKIANLINSDTPCKLSRASPLPRISDKNEEQPLRKFSKGMSKYEVFLGGSCNPTTWRTDFAIPVLEKMGISYYNPQQVEEWRPELMEVEYHAKENATVMFFVLDNQTRGVSALIEVAHLAGNRRTLILVIQSYTQRNQIICEEEISKEEYEELKRGQEVLQILMERQGVPVFDNIQVALECTEKILRENLRVQDLQTPVQLHGESSITPRDVFEKLGSKSSGQISASDVCLALKMLTEVEVSVGDLKNLIGKAGRELNGTLVGDVKFDFEFFSELLTQFKRQVEEGMSLRSTSSSVSPRKDVYLGGTIENTSWRESVAIPALEEQNLTYFVPTVSEAGKRFSEIEAAAMNNSFLLLFVITNTARSIAAMAIAGHYIRKGSNVVLCVQHFPEDATVGEEKLSENAVKDYNRGRMYLMDIAERSDVPVFDDISTAVKFVIQKCVSR